MELCYKNDKERHWAVIISHSFIISPCFSRLWEQKWLILMWELINNISGLGMPKSWLVCSIIFIWPKLNALFLLN